MLTVCAQLLTTNFCCIWNQIIFFKKSTDQWEIMLDWVVSDIRKYWDDCRFSSVGRILILLVLKAEDTTLISFVRQFFALTFFLFLIRLILYKNKLSKNCSILTISFFWKHWARTFRNIRFLFRRERDLCCYFLFENFYVLSQITAFLFLTWSLTGNHCF